MEENFGPDIILLERIATGGMAEVFRAKLLGTGGFEKTVAVKRILPHFALKDEFRTRFQQEMNLVARLQHPNIVQVFKNGEEGEYLYLVMEHVDGKSLWSLIQTAKKHNQTIPVQVACHLILEVAKGLDFAHSYRDELSGQQQQIVHRDINPANIMVGYNGMVKLVDFGIAKAVGHVELTEVGDLHGTVPYCSPEQVEGKELDLRTDIFSLGAVFWELLCGRRLFSPDSTFKILQLISECEVPPPSQIRADIPPALEAIILKMLARDRDERYQDDKELIRELTLFKNQHYVDFLASDLSNYVSTLFRDEILKELEQRRTPGSATTEIASLTEHTALVREEEPENQTILAHAGKTSVDFGSKKRRIALISLGMALLLPLVVILRVGFYDKSQKIRTDPIDSPPNERLESTFATDPINLPGIVSWFKAEDLSGKHGSAVSEWRDSKNGHYTLTPTDLKKGAPRIEKRKFKGHTVLHFNGKSNFLVGDSIVETLLGMRTFSIVSVGAVTKKNISRQYIVSLHGVDRDSDVLRLGYGRGFKALAFSNPHKKRYEISENPVSDKGELHVISCVFEPDNGYLFVNGEQVLSWPTGKLGTLDKAGTFSVGMEWDKGKPSDFFGGFLAELIVFNRSLFKSERSLLEDKLLKKYNISRE